MFKQGFSLLGEGLVLKFHLGLDGFGFCGLLLLDRCCFSRAGPGCWCGWCHLTTRLPLVLLGLAWYASIQLWIELWCRVLEPFAVWLQAVEPITQNPQLLLLLPRQRVPALGCFQCIALCLLCLLVQQVVLKPQTHLLDPCVTTLAACLVGGQRIAGKQQRKLSFRVSQQVIHQ